jgi:hypothetical protein
MSPMHPPVKRYFFLKRFPTSRILWAEFAVESRCFGDFGKTSDEVKL